MTRPNIRCRIETPADYPARFYVPDQLTDWKTEFPDYDPVVFDSPRAQTSRRKPGDYADPPYPAEVEWSRRRAFSGSIIFDETGTPLNPGGRTGIRGRGSLNAWGPTLAAEAIITRDAPSGLELLVITRTDNHKPALTAGKLAVNHCNEPIETSLQAAKREALEEAGVDLAFESAQEVYRGYVDDERNTDNAWMETVALHRHLTETEAGRLILRSQAADAKHPRWEVVNDRLIDMMHANNGWVVRLAVGL